ncbi:cgr1 family domain-containing protein [Ditylenchus destructor]|uniref:Coiled-coil domain-containing protein 86 n=1 Tax=Ditylenchus destructor TaxID=166010 RepID=A0AAD4N3Q3_9BILA|nr:cgr1 family domain-containing protein [Ditylenchus destructor]
MDSENNRSDDNVMELEPSQTTLVQPMRGMPKSGRWWKDEHKQRHSAVFKVKPFKSSWQKKMQDKNTQKMVKLKQEEIRQSLKEEKVKKIAEGKEREERRKANIKKAEVVQVIRNTAKLKHTKRKQLRKIEMRDIPS